MKKTILFIIMIIATGCSYSKNLEQNNLKNETLIGMWDFTQPIENGWAITSYIFYEENQCSLHMTIIIQNNSKLLGSDDCTYKISGTNLYINDELYFIYNEETKKLHSTNGSVTTLTKITNDPCNGIYSKCNNND